MTEVQRKVITWMLQVGGAVVIQTGHKTVETGFKTSNGNWPAIKGNVNLVQGLQAQGWVQWYSATDEKPAHYRLTQKALDRIKRMRHVVNRGPHA